MARLALGVAGAVAGSFFGSPQIGWMIGSMIGGVVDPQVISNHGPRLSDLKVQVSSWGVNVPIYYGTYRGAGNVIWSTPLQETATTTEEGGKGGPSVENTTYSYSVNLAIALCEGEISGIRKIWADGRLIYNVGDDATAESLTESQSFASGFKVYPGSQTQMPDPTIEADKGAGNVSAYRGLAYVVFEGFQLGNYGNRIPNFEFEVIESGAITTSTQYIGTGIDAITWNNTVSHVSDFSSIRMFCGDWDNSYASSNVDVIDILTDGTVVRSGRFVTGSNQTFARGTSDESCLVNSAGTSGGQYYWYYASLAPGVSDPSDMNITEEIFITPVSLGSSDVRFCKKGRTFVIGSYAFGGGDAYVFDFVTKSRRTLTLPAYTANFALTDTYLYVLLRNGQVRKYLLSDLSLVSTLVTLSTAVNLICAVGDDEIYVSDGSTIYEVSSGTAVAHFTASFSLSSVSVHTMFVRGDAAIVYHGNSSVYLLANKITNTPVTCSAIVADQCERSGLGLADIDVSALADEVSGYAITRQGTARANIEQLRQAYYFDAVETDNKLKFVKRGGAVAVTVPYEDLAAHEPGGQAPNPLDIRRLQEVELPQQISIKFANVDGDYQIGSEKSSRLVTASKNQVSVDLAIAMDADKAAQIADVLLFDAHAARTPIKFSTTKKYAKYSPTDILVLQTPTASYRARITKKDEAGPLINWEGLTDDATIYTSSVTGGTSGQTQTQITTPGPTNAVFMDIPLIRDEDDNAGLYVAMGGYKAAWYGAALFRSPDDSAFNNIASVSNNATIGTCGTTLGNWNGGNFFDETNTLDVTLASGSLSSATHDQVLNGANAALVGSEIIQFKNAVLIGANQYRLSGLLRGRRGTEQHQSTHAASERFVLFSVAGIARPVETAASIGAIRYYKPVSFGRTQTQTSSLQYTNTAIGLMPYSPVNLSGGKQTNGDFTIAWHRRTRVDGGWRDSVDAALGEDAQSYEVDIMSGATVKRTLTSSTPTVTYTAAQQTTDFGSAQSTITVKVYQISATVGRGFPATKTY